VAPQQPRTTPLRATRTPLRLARARAPTRRRGFLSAGTMAKGAAESGLAESYMCSKVARSPLVQSCCAAYLGEFEAQQGAGGIQKGTQWLVGAWCGVAWRRHEA
jgi:hypothetical protein